MKRTIITCDMCGKNITYADTKYKFKRYNIMNYGRSEFLKWKKMDMCEECYKKLEHYIPHQIDIERIFDKIRYLGSVEGDTFSIANDDLKKLEYAFKEKY